MSLEDGWAQARAIYQQHGKLTDFLQPKCEQDVTTRNGWLEAYRHWWITGTVPPARPAEQVETPWNMETWPLKPWENAEYQSENNYTQFVPDYISAQYDPQLFKNFGFNSKIIGYQAQCYDPGSICQQVPQTGVAHPYCVISCTLSI